MTRKSSLSVAALLLALGLVGCSKESPPPPPAQPAQPAKHPAAPAAPVQKPVSSAQAAPGQVLDFSRRTDPFKPFTPAPAVPPQAKAERPDEPQRPVGDQLPIQGYETSKFRVAGIIAGLRENRALILDPSGKGYVVQQGMQIGSSNGRITRITPSAVEVQESYKDERGRLKKRTIVLQLAKKR